MSKWQSEIHPLGLHQDINKLLSVIQINHQPDATIFQFIILTFIYSSTCFGRSPAHHQELNDCSSSLWFYLRIVVVAVLCSWWGRLWPAATAVIELLMMGGRTPETCWTVNKRQDNELENCCIWLAIYFNCMMMHGLTNPKFLSVISTLLKLSRAMRHTNCLR
jgi:hypothetical protein